MKFSEGGEIKTMYPEAASEPKTVQCSLTDQILTLCMSGRYGVREAIAEAMRHEHEMNLSEPCDTAAERTKDPARHPKTIFRSG